MARPTKTAQAQTPRDEAIDPLHPDDPNGAGAMGDLEPSAPARDTIAAVDDDAPPAYVNPRDAIVKGFRERRDASDADALNAADAAGLLPPFLSIDTPGGEPKAEGDAPAGEDTQPADTGPTYKLKIDRNDMEVDRATLLKMAEVDEAEAADYPDSALIRLAQKQEVARLRLDEARETNRRARSQPATETENGDGDTGAPQTRQPSTTLGEPSEEDLGELARQIQYGEPHEVIEAQRKLTRIEIAQSEARQRFNSGREEARQALESFQSSNPDIFADDTRSDTLAMRIAAEVAKEMGEKIPSLTTKEVADIRSNSSLAINAYVAARAAGHSLSLPGEILARAGQSVRQAFNLANPGQQREAPVLDRRDRKQGLAAIPTAPVRRTPTPPPPAERKASDTIQKMRAARGQ